MTLLSMPLEELPAAGVRELGALRSQQADRAARLDNPDWQILLKLKADGINTLLPDLQAMRSSGQSTAVRFRAEVGRGPDRRRNADREDDVRDGAAHGRAPHLDRPSGRHCDLPTWPSVRWKRCSSSRAARTSTGRSRTCPIRSFRSRRGWTASD